LWQRFNPRTVGKAQIKKDDIDGGEVEPLQPSLQCPFMDAMKGIAQGFFQMPLDHRCVIIIVFDQKDLKGFHRHQPLYRGVERRGTLFH
jgi:hypothetical protein